MKKHRTLEQVTVSLICYLSDTSRYRYAVALADCWHKSNAMPTCRVLLEVLASQCVAALDQTKYPVPADWEVKRHVE